MQFDDQHVDTSNLSDRRGRGGGGGGGRSGGGLPMGRTVGIGGGGLGIVVVIIVMLLGGLGGPDGGNPLGGSGSPLAGGGPSTTSDVATRCNTAGAIDAYDDCFVLKAFNEVNEVWASQVTGYRAPTLVYFEQAVSTACGTASSQVGPFYCPADETVYIDLGFMNSCRSSSARPGATRRRTSWRTRSGTTCSA